ncbi:hypothetical protein K1T71_010390 [Dendrolimus kikuchii]|uniref:Uncharacterized protein n=1 Tax=Dendrolimus kikuchii TaxID=765133 RepID=A0ACC1CRE7_9NEOP|nr:hypothetical protein K1T71_010390 [Dendrolimus kikuchii]
MKTAHVIYFIALFSVNNIFCDEKVEVKLNQGILLGRVEQTLFLKNNYYAFKSFPYAEPPVGELRFQPPQPHKVWNGKYEAYKNKPTCIQFNSRMRLGEKFGLSGSEDCLYISVYTPSLEGSAPVTVFDYNDNFRTGFNGTKTYSSDFFLEEGVVVVTISHRLGLFGYLSTEDNVIPANNGLRDFILGLQWIKDNIIHFGGDPEKVTLMGNSGGAALINILLYSEKAKGLFSAAVLQSGTALETVYFYKNLKTKAFQLGVSLNITADDSVTLLQELQKLKAEQIQAKEVDILLQGDSVDDRLVSLPFVPCVEKDNSDPVIITLPESAKIVNDVPVLIGLNSKEGMDLISHLLFDPTVLPTDADQNLLQEPIRCNFRFDKKSAIYKRANQEVVEHYLADKSLHYNNLLEYAVYAGDVLHSYAINKAAKKLASDLINPVYYYMFDFNGQLNENSQYISKHSRYNTKHSGATVTDELCYLLFCVRNKLSYDQLMKTASEPTEFKVLRKMVRMWTNFFKHRNPTPHKQDYVLKDFTWEPINKNSSDVKYLHITKTLRMKNNPLGERERFWDELLERYKAMTVDGVVTGEDPNHEEL